MNKGQSTQSEPAATPHTSLPNAITVGLSTMQNGYTYDHQNIGVLNHFKFAVLCQKTNQQDAYNCSEIRHRIHYCQPSISFFLLPRFFSFKNNLQVVPRANRISKLKHTN
jgi:hypothetical protein